MEHIGHPDRLASWVTLLGANCRRLRLAAEMEFADVAAVTGLSTGYICNIEHNHRGQHHRTNPTLDVIIKLAAAYNVEPAELLLPEHDPGEYLNHRIQQRSNHHETIG